jgi:hypothetical protein
MTQFSNNTKNLDPLVNAKLYRGSVALTTCAASATDIFEIVNPSSSTKKIYLFSLTLLMKQTVASVVQFTLVKHPIANTGGTTTPNPVITPEDSTMPASSALLKAYTANPTIGTTQNMIIASLNIPTTLTNIVAFSFRSGSLGTVTVIQPGESVAIQFPGAVLAGLSVLPMVTYAEF